jgi:hypothetical protein
MIVVIMVMIVVVMVVTVAMRIIVVTVVRDLASRINCFARRLHNEESGLLQISFDDLDQFLARCSGGVVFLRIGLQKMQAYMSFEDFCHQRVHGATASGQSK